MDSRYACFLLAISKSWWKKIPIIARMNDMVDGYFIMKDKMNKGKNENNDKVLGLA